jgi:adenosylcobyric acid synthase
MNPVLLKPQSEIGAQVVVQGKVWGQAKAREYRDLKPQLLPAVLDSFARLSSEADLVLVEGAGSPAEVNLREGDIANMGFAEAADVPVLLVGDIDRGGVIASLVGTMAVLEAEEKARIRGFIVNKFRGDAALFAAGPCLQGLRPPDLAALRRHRRVVGHVLRLERPHPPTLPREVAAEPGNDQRLADVGPGALEHDGGSRHGG